MKIVKIFHDEDAESPMEFDGSWTLYSFNRRHVNYKNPAAFFGDFGEPNDELKEKLNVGLAFILSYYEHGSCIWSRQGMGQQCQWDTVGVAGVLVWEHKPDDLAKTIEERAKDADIFLATYTAWCNGEVYGYSVEEEVKKPCGHMEIEHGDSCYGFFGPDLAYMFDNIRDALGDDKTCKAGNELARGLLPSEMLVRE